MMLRKRGYLAEGSSSISRNDVVDILARQFGNKDKSRDYLEGWVASDNFKLMDVYVGINDLGVTHGKTGNTRSSGQPIIVDRNTKMVARSYKGIGGAAPDFIVLDGQNRVVAARDKNIRGTIKAYVGNKIASEVKKKNEQAKKVFDKIDNTVRDFMNSPTPGVHFGSMKRYVSSGLMTSGEFDRVRTKWRKKFSKQGAR